MAPETDASIDALVRDATAARDRGPFADVAAFTKDLAAARRPGSTIARAVRSGARADRLGFAFVGGYFSALAALDPASEGRFTCLAATEVGGVHPRAIEAAIQDRGAGPCLRGTKTFVTLADHADDLLVIARLGEEPPEGGRRTLVACRVPAAREGVRIELRPPTPFAPDVSHARVVFEDVAIGGGELLHGNGWDDWLKPFRTIEDAHVLAALCGHALAVARSAEQVEGVAADLAVVIGALLSLEREGWKSAGGHLALEGAFSSARGALARLVASLPEAMDVEKRRLERDAPLLQVAESARQKRLAVALSRVVNATG